MRSLAGKNVVVIGGSRGVGRRIVEAAARNQAHVLAVARNEGALRQLADDVSGIAALPLDATADGAPERVFGVLKPDVLVLCGGALPPVAPLHLQSWTEFATNWETDVRISFQFCKASLVLPLARNSCVVLISSGAALGGSPISGGYAGSKRMQMFMANYSQKESDRLGLGVRFIALAPAGIMPETTLGQHAVAGYSRYLGIPEAEFIKGMASPPTPVGVASAVIELVTGPDRYKGSVFTASGKGIESVS